MLHSIFNPIAISHINHKINLKQLQSITELTNYVKQLTDLKFKIKKVYYFGTFQGVHIILYKNKHQCKLPLSIGKCFAVKND